MHPNPAFRQETEAQHIAFARERGFGVLSVNGTDAPLLSHIPFLLSEDGTHAELHLVRSNPIARLEDGPAAIAVSGPDSYVSPDWYEVPDQVPTWNYVAVHLRGQLERRPEAELRGMLDALSAHFERRLSPKPEWVTTKMTPEALSRMMRQIIPYRLHISTSEGTWKLNQNKPDAVRLRAADRIEACKIGTEAQMLAAMMRAANEGENR